MKGDLGIWKSVDEYVDFAVKHQVFGSEAVKLYKKMNKDIPIPRVLETQSGVNDDFGRVNEYKKRGLTKSQYQKRA